MIVDIYIGNDKLELFKDENISVTSSVLDIQDISKNTTDYTNAFTVPASEVNNKIFKHYYNADIDNAFDARVSVVGRIEIGGLPFREGKILLQKVNKKRGVASSYMINFWGNLVSLKDLLGDDKLSDLDYLSIFNHNYTSLNVVTSLENIFTGQNYLYNLLVKKQYYYNSDSSDDTMTDELANIHYQAGTANGVKWDDLRPSLRLLAIIIGIETKYGLTFSRDFFGTDAFGGLFMWLNNTVDGKVGGGTEDVDYTGGDTTYINLTTNIGTFTTEGISGVSGSTWFNLNNRIIPASGFGDVQYTLNIYSSDVLIVSKTGTGQLFIFNTLSSNEVSGASLEHTIRWELVVTEEFEYVAVCFQFEDGSITATQTTDGGDTIASVFEVLKHIPDMKSIDFLKGIFNAFKLVVIPQNDGTIYIDTVTNYYTNGQTLDLTQYIDIESEDVGRGNILNTIKYKFQEPQTILNVLFKENNLIAYGDEEAQIKDDNDVLLDGDSLEIELPFEQIIYERLIDLAGTDTIELMYGAVVDKELKPVNPKAHIFYNQQYRVDGDGIGFIDDNGDKSALRGLINTASHTISDSNPADSFIFSEEFNNFTGEILTNNLYSNYHQEYINNLFNIKRRNFKFKIKTLPVSVLLDLTLDDIIIIGFNFYRIDKFTTDLNSGKTELNLVNLL